MHRRRLIIYLALLGVAILLGACAGPAGEQGPPGPAGPPGPEGPQGPPGPAAEMLASADLSCTQCHNDTTLIDGKATAWSTSLHGTGDAYVRGTSASCAGCHSGGGFSAMIDAGQNPSQVESGDPNPTRQDCRTCHEIHTTYTAQDWALETTNPVTLYAFEGVSFDGGKGNLCANCHEPRSAFPEAVDGMVEVDSTHWGPHHGPQSAMLLGVGGARDVAGGPSAHASVVTDTCVTCHMGENTSHTFEPDVATCQSCHADVENFDINGTQTAVTQMAAQLQELLLGKGLLDDQGNPTVASFPEAEAAALWNWIYVVHEDKSLGVHNPAYTKALLQASIDALQ